MKLVWTEQVGPLVVKRILGNIHWQLNITIPF